MTDFQYGKDYLKWWYFDGGAQYTIFGNGSAALPEGMKKAVGPWDAPTSPYTYDFQGKYSLEIEAYTQRASEFYKLVPKTTFLASGDSMKYYETDLAGLNPYTYAGTPFASESAEAEPTLAEFNQLRPAYLIDPWETSLMSRTESTWKIDPSSTPEKIKAYHAENLGNQLDKLLQVQVDTATTATSIESIDRIISSENESGVATHVSHTTDGDIYWGKAGIQIDRSADTDETFGAGAGDGISLPTTAAARYLDLDFIDDVIAASGPYSKRKNYIGFTGPQTINEIQKLIDPKQRYFGNPMEYQLTLNGVKTRQGEKTGFTVGAIVSNGITIPMFSSTHCPNESSANRSATVTDANIGNIYFIDLDAIELRTAIPITYMESAPNDMMAMDALKTRHWFMYAAQLIATNFRCHAAVKYLKKS